MYRRLKSSVKFTCSVIFISTLCVLTRANAQDETLYDVYSLSAEVRQEIDNDLMVATLVVQDQHKDSAKLADSVNQTMAWALDTLAEFESLSIKTKDYYTQPQYDTGKTRRLIGWRASQTLQIETDNFGNAGSAIQKLQEKLQVQGIRFSINPDTRSVAEDSLIQEALSAFRARALLVQEAMGFSGYQVVDVSIQTNQSGSPYPVVQTARYEMMKSSDSIAEPAIESGKSVVSVQVYGRIQLR